MLLTALTTLALASSLGHADGTAVWLQGQPDPTRTPGATSVTLHSLAPDEAWGEADARAIAHLAAEVAAVGPLRHELDGELQMMRRLGAALDAVELVRAEDRGLVWSARVLQGYAVQRYFQDTLGADPAAAPYRREVDGRVEVGAWLDAVALDPDRLPTAEELPDEPELLAFQELRARLLLRPAAALVATGLLAGARLVVDGREAPGERQQLTPGVHLAAIVRDGRVLQRARLELAPGEQRALRCLAPAADLVAVGEALSAGPPALALSEAVIARLGQAEAPVELVVEGRRGPLRYAVIGASAVPVEERGGARDAPAAAVVLHGGVGAGWLYDGDFLLQNAAAGAPDAVATVNAAAPVATAGVTAELGAFAVGLGLDGALPLGAWHTLPVGESVQRLRLYPHLDLGHPLLQLTVGALLPWHLGLGPRLRLPLPDTRSGPLELVAAYTHGVPLPMTAADGVSEFEAGAARVAWVGVGGRLRRPD